MPWTWKKEEWREILTYILIFILAFYFGRFVQCQTQDAYLGYGTGGSLYDKYINPQCISTQCFEYPETCLEDGTIIKEPPIIEHKNFSFNYTINGVDGG
jgi:hypothetical protein